MPVPDLFVCAAVFWFYAVEVEAVVIAMGVPARIAEWLSPAAFCFGLLLVAFAMSVELYERFRAAMERCPLVAPTSRSWP